MRAKELREKFVKFFESKGHKHLPSSSLIPEDDPSVLLTTAGMQQFKKWFTGVENPRYPRVVTIQKCVRIDDIEEVGDENHLSFFEMLGNFAFDDYFKKEAIQWGIEFIRDILKVSAENMSFTYFAGEGDLPEDTESLMILKSLKIPKEKIKPMGKSDNFWGPTGDEGPCGPTVEIYVDGVEAWNIVFNQYYKKADGKYELLDANGVDTGLGFERILAYLNNKDSFYETELFSGIIAEIKKIASKEDKKSERIIADHLRAAAFLLADGVLPSNLDKGYVLRRLIRRAVGYGRILGIKENFASKIAETVINTYKNYYSELKENKEKIIEELNKEEKKFTRTLEMGLREIRKWTAQIKIYWSGIMSDEYLITIGQKAFDFFQKFGFPLEMTLEELRLLGQEKGVLVNETVIRRGFQKEFEKHQEISRKGLEKKFKGGLATGGEQETKYHTTTHLLHQALRTVLGDHVKQAGSNITQERLRFDFTHPEKMTPEQISQTEELVNQQIKAGLPVTCEEMTVQKAQEKGAIGLFEAKYGERIKVYSIGQPDKIFSMEICGGPHVKNTAELGKFKITKEEASSAGVRRIKAILE